LEGKEEISEAQEGALTALEENMIIPGEALAVHEEVLAVLGGALTDREENQVVSEEALMIREEIFQAQEAVKGTPMILEERTEEDSQIIPS